MQTKNTHVTVTMFFSSPTVDGKSTLVFETTNYVMKYLPRINQGLHMCKLHLQLWEAMEPSLDALHWYNSGRIPNDIFTTISRIEVNRIISLRLKSSASLTGKNSDRKKRCDFAKNKQTFRAKRYLTPLKTDIAPENKPSQKETSIPTIHFQVPC